ncbi:hypothetical protein FRC05_003598 [Tulasnella sp. 425]|nr:hypothetical protein FRC05_003598 [Tulasnella sp. 425]
MKCVIFDSKADVQKPSITPSKPALGVLKERSAALLLELGRMYGLENNTEMAESHYHLAIDIATRTKDDKAKANALIGLGEVYRGQSRYREAVRAFMEAHQIHSRIGNDNGTADALDGLGEVYSDQSRYREAEKAFMEAHEIHSRISNDRGVGNALIGLGKVYSAQSLDSEAKKAFSDAHKIHSRIGNERGAADALNGLGDVYSGQSKYREAEKAFTEAREMHCRIGNDNGAADSSNGLGEVYSDQSRYHEAEKAFMEAHEIHSRIGNERGVGNALIGLGKAYIAQSMESEAKKAFSDAHDIHSRIGNERGAADALNGLGDVYSAQSRDSEAKETIATEREINSHIGDDCEVADAPVGLGDQIYNAQSRYSEREEIFIKARESSRILNKHGYADALMGLGKVHSAQSRDSAAETAFSKARDIHFRIGNDRGVGNALINLGKVYSAQSRYYEAEKAFMEAREIHSRIGNHFGVGNALIGLGGVYDAQSRDLEAEKAYIEAHKIHSRIGTWIVAVNTLIALGDNYHQDQSRDSEARHAYKDAQEILSRIGKEFGAKNVPSDPEDTDDEELSDSEDEEALKEASGIHSRTLTETRTWNEQEDEKEPREIPPAEPRNLYEIGTAPTISAFDDGTSASASRQNPNQWNDSESGSLPVPSTPVYKTTEASLPEPSSPPCSPQTFATLHNAPYLLQPPSRRRYQASASSQLASASQVESRIHNDSGSTSAADNQQASFIQDLASIESISMPSTQHIINLILALAKTAPTAIRNKHQLYRILVISRDLCWHLHRVAHTGGESSSGLDVLEQCWEIMDNLERTLLELNDIVSQETMAFGAVSLATWNNSRTGLSQIYGKLTAPPFDIYGADDSTNATWDRYFDDCSWMSLLLLEGIELPIQNMHPEDEEGFSVKAQNSIDRLNYLVNETRLNGNTDEPTRELFIKILSDLANVMMNVPENPSADFWNAADGALQDIDPEKGLNQDLVDSLRDSWGRFADRQIQQGPARRVSTLPPSQDPIAVSLPHDLTRLNHEITPAAEPLVLLLQSLGRGAPTAARNKHKIYAIVSRARDICNDILAVGVRPEVNGLETLDEYYSLIDALEGILLDVARLLPAEQASFGREICASWPENREELRKILNRLHEPPFRLDPSVPKQELMNSSVFDDHYWLSLLLEEGIEKELARQYLDTEMPPALVSVGGGLRYLENEIKCGYHEESTRELVIDIAFRFYEALSASVSEKGSDSALPIRTAEPSPPITLDKDKLVAALSTAFSVLDLESSLESQNIHRLAGSWWGSSHSLPRRRPGSLGETKPAGAGSSGPVQPEEQRDQKTPQDLTKNNEYWKRLHNFARKNGLAATHVEVEDVSARGVSIWTSTVMVSINGQGRAPLEFTRTGLSKREAREAAARLVLVSLVEIVGEE